LSFRIRYLLVEWIQTFWFFIVSRRYYSFVTFLFFRSWFFSNTPVNKFLNIVYQCVILHVVHVRGRLHNDNIIIIILRLYNYIICTHIFSCGIIIRISDGPLFVTEMKKINIKMHTYRLLIVFCTFSDVEHLPWGGHDSIVFVGECFEIRKNPIFPSSTISINHCPQTIIIISHSIFLSLNRQLDKRKQHRAIVPEFQLSERLQNIILLVV